MARKGGTGEPVKGVQRVECGRYLCCRPKTVSKLRKMGSLSDDSCDTARVPPLSGGSAPWDTANSTKGFTMSNQPFAISVDDLGLLPPAMLRDFRSIASLTPESVASVGRALSGLPPSSSSDVIEKTIRQCLTAHGKEEAAGSVLRALMNVDADSISHLIGALRQWASVDEKRREAFSDEVVHQLQGNLELLIAANPAVRIMQKAERLLRDVGNELQSVKFVCDLRPVFDDAREHVEAFVTIANMRLLYVSQDGERRACEMALTEGELVHLKEHVDGTLAKLRVLGEVRPTLTSDATCMEGEE